MKGISERKAMEISDQVSEKRDLRQAMIFLQQYGITLNLAVKIYKEYGQEVYGIIQENPYRLADDISGVGFRIADEIAKKVGIHTDSDFRIRSGILYTLLQASGEGHTFLPEEELTKRAGELLGVTEEAIEKQYIDLSIERKIIMKQEGEQVQIYGAPLYYTEVNTAMMLKNLDIAYDVSDAEITQRIHKIEKQTGMELDEHQKEAVSEAVRNGLLVITGGPGTGKTTTITVLSNILNWDACRKILVSCTTWNCPLSIISFNTLPGPTLGSWFTSPTRISLVPATIAFRRDCIRLISTIDISSIITTSVSSGLLSFRSNPTAPSIPPFNSSIRCMVLASYPVISLIRFAALPVGAARKMSRPSSSKYLIILLIVVVLPVPGPPVITKIFRQASQSDIIVNAQKSTGEKK